MGLRGPAEMLGVAELACQIFLEETVVGSVRHTSEKLLKTFKIGSLIQQTNGDDKTGKTGISAIVDVGVIKAGMIGLWSQYW